MKVQQQHSFLIEERLLNSTISLQYGQISMYAYDFAYFLQNQNRQIFFESNQHDLENATRTLLGFFEFEITGMCQDSVRECRKWRLIVNGEEMSRSRKSMRSYKRDS
jgi:hypothetical protein